jgi:SAM-dependent methyltransferase
MINPNNPYTNMQKRVYGSQSPWWSVHRRDPVVGTFDAHNKHSDYELLFKGIDTKELVALDFGCGPGRNIVKYAGRFRRIDGVDLDYANLLNAKSWADHNGLNGFKLYLCNGVDLGGIGNDEYDLVMTTITLQHICVHEIRQNYFREFCRVLKPGGRLSFQMGFGSPSPNAVSYYANHYEATATNRGCDTEVSDPDHLKEDLGKAGFDGFEYDLRPPGPGDYHPQWIFVRARSRAQEDR